MSLPVGWIAVAAGLAVLLGLWLMLVGQGMRQRRGLGSGKTVSLDRVTLTSHRLGLTGRPDRLIKADGTIIVEEWKIVPAGLAFSHGTDGLPGRQ
jgi:CRISPR-associated exonuclease Cas4